MRKTLVVLLAAMAMTSAVYAKDYHRYSRRAPQTQQYAQFVSKQQAGQAALDAIWQQYQQNAFVDEVELKNKNGDAYYKVEVKLYSGKEYDVYVDAKTGQVKQTNVSYDEAGKIAEQAVFERYQTSGRIGDVELKYKNARSYYEVEIKTFNGMEFDVNVDAQTGNVLRIKMDD